MLEIDGQPHRRLHREADAELLGEHGRLRHLAGARSARYPAGLPFGFDDLMLDLLEPGRGRRRATRFDGYWLDIGRPDDYDRANEEFPALKADLLGQT